MKSLLLVFAVLLSLAPLARADRPYPVMAGDPAPALAVQAWVQGDPVPAFERGKVYVIDFWATWCGPCKQSMPALSALQREMGERVTVVGVDTWDYADRVAPFVAGMGEQLSYRIAIDRQPAPPAGEDNIPMYVKAHGECSLGWMVATGYDQEGIPTLFVVDGEGRIAWIGDDVEQLREVLKPVLAGTWDLAGYSARYAKDAVMLKRGRTLQASMWEKRKKKEWRGAIDDGKTLLAVDDRYASYAGTVFRLTYASLGERKEALAFAGAQMKRNRDASAFEDMAWTIAADTTHAADLAAAEKLARHASALAKDAAPGPWAVRAKIALRRGDRAAAVQHQTRAVALTTDAEEKTAAEAKLAEYRR